MLAQADRRSSHVAEAPGAPAAPALGTVVDGRYRLEERIGCGGMGIVYRAEHVTLGASFAIKVLRPELLGEPAMVDRLLLEARAASRIASDHVVPIVDAGVLDGGVPFLVMPLLVGEDLQTLLARSERLPPVRAVNLGLDACRGLAAAHARGLVHRDLKPANLFVSRSEDGTDRLKLLDFGVVKQVGHEATLPGGLVGTVRYMAPEQMGLEAPIGPATDVFALGVILYRCLAGELPFAGDTTERIIFKTMTSDADPLSRRCPGLPEGLSDVIGRALAKHPADRFASAEAFAEALRPFAGARRARSPHDSLASLDATVAEAERGAPPVAIAAGARLQPGRALATLGGALIGAALTLAVGGAREPSANLSAGPSLACTPAAATTARPPDTTPRASDDGEPSEPPGLASAAAATRAATNEPASPAAALEPLPRATHPSAGARRDRARRASPPSAEVRRPPPPPFFDPENPYAPRPQR